MPPFFIPSRCYSERRHVPFGRALSAGEVGMDECFLCSLVAGHLATLVVSVFYAVLTSTKDSQGLVCFQDNSHLLPDKQLQQTLCDVTSYGCTAIAGYSLFSIIILPCLLASKSFRAVQASLNACAVLFSMACGCFLLLCFLFWCNALTQDDPSASCYQMAVNIDPQRSKLLNTKEFFWTAIVQISSFSLLIMVSMLMLLAYALRTASPTYHTLGEIHVTSRRRLTPQGQRSGGETDGETTPLIQTRPLMAASA